MSAAYGKTRTKHRRKNRRFDFYLAFSAIALIIIAVIDLVINSPLLQIKSFQIQSNQAINEIAVNHILKIQILKKPLSAILGSKNYFFWPKTGLQAIQFSEIKISKNFKNKEVILEIYPKNRYATWCLTSQSKTSEGLALPSCYWIDEKGVIFDSGPITKGQLIPSFYSSEAISPVFGSLINSENNFNIIKKIVIALKDMNISINQANIDTENQEFELITTKNTKLIFSLDFDPEKSAIPAAKELSQTIGLANLEYLNLTVENRAFYKLR
jgi:hypothetical protein